MQHVGRRLAVASPPIGAEITLPDLRGDRPFPLTLPMGPRAWQEIYLDNWDAVAVFPAQLADAFLHHPLDSQLRLRAAWDAAHVVRNVGKAVEGQTTAINKGAEFSSALGTIGPSVQRLGELMYVLLSLCASEDVSQARLQIGLGLAAHCCTFRRPLFAILAQAYRASADPNLHGPLSRP
eukprot:2613200-Amphidinium_carterae.1